MKLDKCVKNLMVSFEVWKNLGDKDMTDLFNKILRIKK